MNRNAESMSSPFEMVFDQIADRYDGAISLSDLSQNDAPLVGINSAFSRLTGFAEHEILGRNCRFLQGGASPNKAKSLLSDSIAKRTPIVTCITNYTKAGVQFENLLFIDFIIDQNGYEYSIGVQNLITKENWQNDTEAATFKSTNVLSLIKDSTDRSYVMGKAWQSQTIASVVSSHIKSLHAEELQSRAQEQMQSSERHLQRSQALLKQISLKEKDV